MNSEKEIKEISATNTTTGFTNPIIDDAEINIVNKKNGSKHLKDIGIVISGATAKWRTDQTDNAIENINLTLRPGRLVAVIGPVGAGKVWNVMIQTYLKYITNISHIFSTEFTTTSNFTRIATY